MHNLKPNLFRLTVTLVSASLLAACTPAPLVPNQLICRQQPQLPECRHSNQYHGGNGYVNSGSGRSSNRPANGDNSFRSDPGVSSVNSPRAKSSPFFSGRTGFGSFGRGGFGLG